MRVFVTGTGRCGTSTFYQACRHIRNYTSGHETQTGSVPHHFFADNHIEIASQLVPAIPRLRARYPDAKWVHLVRSKEQCVKSLRHQCWDSMAAFAKQWFLCSHPADVYEGAETFYELVNELCESLLPHNSIQLEIDKAYDQWPIFWKWIGAEGSMEAGRAEFLRAYNPGINRGLNSYAATKERPVTEEIPDAPVPCLHAIVPGHDS